MGVGMRVPVHVGGYTRVGTRWAHPRAPALAYPALHTNPRVRALTHLPLRTRPSIRTPVYRCLDTIKLVPAPAAAGAHEPDTMRNKEGADFQIMFVFVVASVTSRIPVSCIQQSDNQNSIAFGSAPRREADNQAISRSVREAVSQAVSWARTQVGRNTQFGFYQWWITATNNEESISNRLTISIRFLKKAVTCLYHKVDK